MSSIPVGSEPRDGWIVASAGSSGDDQKHAARNDRTRNLRNNVSGDMLRFKLATQQQPECDGGIDMASGYRSNCISHHEERKAEGKRDALEADVATGKDRGATTAEDEYE